MNTGMIAKLNEERISFKVKATSFFGNDPINSSEAQADTDRDIVLPIDSANWLCTLRLVNENGEIINGQAAFMLESGLVPCGNVSVSLQFDDWATDNYVLMPAAVYNGNRFQVSPAKYPPMLHEEDGIGPDMPVTITDVPRLNLGDGPSEIHFRSGDMSTPAVGIWIPAREKGFLLLFEHVTAFGYTGVRLRESDDRASAVLEIEAPAVRQRMYTMVNSGAPSDDVGARFQPGDAVTLNFKILLFNCPDIPALFDAYAAHRKDLCGSHILEHNLPLSAAYRIIERKYNESQFNEVYGYYMLTPNGQGSRFGDWQAGWCGGGMSSLALSYNGSEISQERANRTIDAVFGVLQHNSGFIVPVFSDGKASGDDFSHSDKAGVLLVRKDADVLVFAARHILLLQQRGVNIPAHWLGGLKALADAFARLWEQYGQFGQFIDMDIGEIILGGTASGSMAPGGLILAWKILGKDRYRGIAEESARYYYKNFVRNGLLNGGPGEALQCPDSESASNMLESFVTLYEITGSHEWLPMAEETANICASWCVSYDFVFPSESAFGKLGVHTLGSVFANTQNKHSAPGFCTISGASLLRLYRATGNKLFLEMCRETAHGITQYLSREDRPIPSWDGKGLPAGWMCERVNMSDWEGKAMIGGVFRGSNWCEVSCLLTYAEIPGIWFLADTGDVVTIDHVDVSVSDAGNQWTLRVRNPTAFDAEVKLFCDTRKDFSKPLDACAMDRCRIISVAAHGFTTVEVEKAASMQPRAIYASAPDLQYNE